MRSGIGSDRVVAMLAGPHHAPTLEGQYVLKDIILVTAALVVRSRAIDLARRNGNDPADWASDDRLDERPAPDDVNATVIERDTAVRRRASLTRLPDEHQEVITLAYYGQLSHTEIATQLRLPPGTVKGRMRLGLQSSAQA